MPEITSHAEYLALQKRLRSLRGVERAKAQKEITRWKNHDALNRGRTGGALVRQGQQHGDAELVRLGMNNPNGLTPRAHRKAGW